MFGWKKKAQAPGSRPSADPPYRPTPRALETASYVEIAMRIKALEASLRAVAYVFRDSILVTRTIGQGLNVEVEAPLVLPLDTPDDILGRTICDQLLAFRRGPLPDLSGSKASDWQVYRASGSPSAKQFRAGSWRVSIETIGDSLRLEASPGQSLHEQIAVSAITRPDHAAVGEAFRRAVRGAQALRDAGIV